MELLQADAGLITGATEHARGRAEQMAARLSFSVGKVKVGKAVQVTLGEMLLEPGACRIPLKWKVAGKGMWLFPQMEGTLEVQTLSDLIPECQVSLTGVYTPPLGSFGAITDLLVMHQVAEASVCAFVQELKGRIEAALSENIAVA